MESSMSFRDWFRSKPKAAKPVAAPEAGEPNAAPDAITKLNQMSAEIERSRAEARQSLTANVELVATGDKMMSDIGALTARNQDLVTANAEIGKALVEANDRVALLEACISNSHATAFKS